MTTKVNGAAYSGIWVERQVIFIKITFNKDIAALTDVDLSAIGTPTALNPTNAVAVGTIADSTFAVVESALVQALKAVETRATVLGISTYDATAFAVDVMLGYAEGWFSDIDGLIQDFPPVPVPPATGVILVQGAKAIVTTAGAADPSGATTVVPVGGLVDVDSGSFPGIAYKLEFVKWDGTMPVSTGVVPVPPATTPKPDLIIGPGSTSGATPPNSPTGTPGYYPRTYPHV